MGEKRGYKELKARLPEDEFWKWDVLFSQRRTTMKAAIVEALAMWEAAGREGTHGTAGSVKSVSETHRVEPALAKLGHVSPVELEYLQKLLTVLRSDDEESIRGIHMNLKWGAKWVLNDARSKVGRTPKKPRKRAG